MFGEGTRYKEGDYYINKVIICRSFLTIADMEKYVMKGSVREILDDPDLMVAEGL